MPCRSATFAAIRSAKSAGRPVACTSRATMSTVGVTSSRPVRSASDTWLATSALVWRGRPSSCAASAISCAVGRRGRAANVHGSTLFVLAPRLETTSGQQPPSALDLHSLGIDLAVAGCQGGALGRGIGTSVPAQDGCWRSRARARFVDVPTGSPRDSLCKGAPPVDILPGGSEHSFGQAPRLVHVPARGSGHRFREGARLRNLPAVGCCDGFCQGSTLIHVAAGKAAGSSRERASFRDLDTRGTPQRRMQALALA